MYTYIYDNVSGPGLRRSAHSCGACNCYVSCCETFVFRYQTGSRNVLVARQIRSLQQTFYPIHVTDPCNVINYERSWYLFNITKLALERSWYTCQTSQILPPPERTWYLFNVVYLALE